METDDLVFNGIDGASGRYLLEPLSPAEFARKITGETDKEHLQELKWWNDWNTTGHFDVKEGTDPKELSQSGWGIIFAYNADPAVRAALQELIDFRKELAASLKEHFFKEYSGPDGYRPGETKQNFLARHGAGPGPADPEKVPYYLLIVGDPETIPYRFQYQLDVQYAVGRIHFDTLEEYAQYAHSVVEAEKSQLALGRKAAFFGVGNEDDRATNMSADELVAPLAASLTDTYKDWTVDSILREQATKERLSDLLGGPQTPALFFTASHGMSFPLNDPRQLPHQGALLCQDWPGPRQWAKAIPEDFYFSADDLSDDARLLGLLAFTFACYGAGTPRLDDFAQQTNKGRVEIAPHAFLSRLPQRMLSHPKGGALAVVGHVERAWSYSFNWGKAGRQLTVFEDTLKRLLDGAPIGHAVGRFNERYAELSSDLSAELEEISFGKKANALELAGMWTANNDSRNFVVLGDPAVKLMVASESTGKAIAERPVIQVDFKAGAAALAAAEPSQPQPASPAADESSTSPAKDFGLPALAALPEMDVNSSVEQYLQKVTAFLESALEHASILEVATCTSSDPGQVTLEGGQISGGRLRALTRMKISGDTVVVLAEQNGNADPELWKMHLEMVHQAQASRAELLKAIVAAAESLSLLLRSKTA